MRENEMDTTTNKIIETKTLVIGFGFSTLPLYRELDRTGEEYLIISDPDPKPIWETLRKGGNLDFDLVSSYYTSYIHSILLKILNVIIIRQLKNTIVCIWNTMTNIKIRLYRDMW